MLNILTYNETTKQWTGNGYYPGSDTHGQFNGVAFKGPYQTFIEGWFVRIDGKEICCNQTGEDGLPINLPMDGIQLFDFLQRHSKRD